MALLNIVYVATAAFYLVLVAIVRRMSVRGREHALLILSALALFQWTLTAYFVYNTNTLEVARVLLPISCVGMIAFFPLNLHFGFAVSTKRKLPAVVAIAIYSIAGALTAINVVHPFSMLAVEAPDGTVTITPAFDSPLNLVWMVFVLSCWLIPVWFYARYLRKTKLNRERRQARLLLTVIVVTILLVMGEYYLVPLIPGWELPSQSPILFACWMAAMVYAIWRYGFLQLSPGLLHERILDSVEDLVVLYGTDGHAVFRNRKADLLLAASTGKPCRDRELVERGIAPLLARRDEWTSDEPERRLTLRLASNGFDGPNDEGVTVRFRLKALVDRFGDPLGVLVSGTLVASLADATKRYGFTSREADVLERLMAGWTIERTADALAITERTVKAHITSLYDKTGASNRVELANMVIPDWSTQQPESPL